MIFDTHAHYDDEAFDDDREKLLERMQNRGVEYIVNVGASMSSCKSTIGLVRRFPYVYGALGVHPDEVSELTEEDYQWLKKSIYKPKIVAVGEIGLDYHWNDNKEQQIEWFEKQMDIAPIYLDDSPSLSIHELSQQAIRLVSDFQIKLIIVDYLQLMNAGLLFSDRNEEMAYIIRRLKALAKDLNIPIIVFSSVYRRESREEIDGIRPQLRDLRYDAIEQDADMICFIHRPEFYRIYNDINGNDLHGKAEIIVAKNRNGNRGDVLLKFNGEYSSFDNLDE